MTGIFTTVLPVLVMLGIGSICRRRGVFTREGIDALKSFVVNIALAAVLVNAFATMEYSLMNVVLAVIMFGLCVLSWFLGRLFSRTFGDSPFVPYMVSGFEAGMLGYAFYTMLYGTEHISEFAKLDLGQVLFVFTFYKIMLGMEEGAERKSGLTILREMFGSTTIPAILAGLVIGISGLHGVSPVGELLDACTSFISAPTAAAILLAIGYDLVPGRIPWRAAIRTIGCRLAILAAGRVVLGLAFAAMGLSGETLKALNVMLILPPPFVLSVFSDDTRQQTYLSAVLTLSTVVSIAGFLLLAVASNI